MIDCCVKVLNWSVSLSTFSSEETKSINTREDWVTHTRCTYSAVKCKACCSWPSHPTLKTFLCLIKAIPLGWIVFWSSCAVLNDLWRSLCTALIWTTLEVSSAFASFKNSRVFIVAFEIIFDAAYVIRLPAHVLRHAYISGISTVSLVIHTATVSSNAASLCCCTLGTRCIDTCKCSDLIDQCSLGISNYTFWKLV